jgi:hypothetical protein
MCVRWWVSEPRELVDRFWEGERPEDWPDAIPFPPQVVVLEKDWVRRRREELGLSERHGTSWFG